MMSYKSYTNWKLVRLKPMKINIANLLHAQTHRHLNTHRAGIWIDNRQRLTERETDRFREMSNYLISIEETALE